MKKIFTHEQLSLFFKIALLMNAISLSLDLIIYHYFDNNNIIKIISENLNNVSFFMISLTIISQAMLIFIQNHQTFVMRYKIIALSTEICLSILFLWLLNIDNDIQEKVIIFASSLSKFDHSYRLSLILIAIFIYIALDFYRTLTIPLDIDETSVPQILRTTAWLVLKKHLFIGICIFGLVHFKKIHKFGIALFHHSQSLLIYDFTILEIIMTITWLGTIAYFLYQQYQRKNKSK